MKKSVKKLLCGGLSLLVCCSVGIGLSYGSADEKAISQEDELRAYYVESETVSQQSTFGHTATDGVFPTMPTLEGVKASLAANEWLVMREVIDLKDYKYNESLLRLNIAPEELGEAEAYCLKVQMIDAYDSNNYITIQMQPGRGYLDNTDVGYTLAAASNGQALTGNTGSNISVGTWGCWTYWNFAANEENLGFDPAQQCFSIGFDYKENQLYMIRYNGVVRIVADFDDPQYYNANLWDGFTTGEVYMRIGFDKYEKSRANCVVQQYGDRDLTKRTIENTEAPRLTIDYKGYSDVTIPQALVGKEYPLFEATAFDLYSGVRSVNVNVYTNYYSSNPIKQPIYGYKNSFVPTVETSYYVEYTSEDSQGKKAVKVVEIPAVRQIEPLQFTFEEYADTTQVGEAYELPKYDVTGGSGRSDVKISVFNEGAELSQQAGSVRPVKVGTMTVAYTATDYLGQTKTQTLTVNVTATEKPTFVEKPVLPKYFVEGNRYVLPTVVAYDFISSNGAPVATTVEVVGEDGGTFGTLNGNTYLPQVDAHKKTVTVIYKAEVNGKENVYESEPIPVFKTTGQNGLDMTKYFDADEASVEYVAHENGIDINTAQDARITFINAVYSQYATLEFEMKEDSFKLGALSILLTDYENANNQIKFTYENGSGYVYLNDKKDEKVLSSMLFGEGTLFAWQYDGKTRSVSYDTAAERILQFKENLAGESFEGFASDRFYITFCLENVKGNAGFTLRTINANFFSNATREWMGPNLEIKGSFGGEIDFGSSYTLNDVIASDLLEGDTDVYLTVLDPDGKTMKAVNGTALENLLVKDGKITVSLVKYGTYFITYTSKDRGGNESKLTYTVRVIDEVKPTITLAKEPVKEAKVGDSVVVPYAVAKDNYDGTLQVEVTIVYPTLEMLPFDKTAKGFKATMSGTYRIVYRACDSEGNLTIVMRTVTVKEG